MTCIGSTQVHKPGKTFQGQPVAFHRALGNGTGLQLLEVECTSWEVLGQLVTVLAPFEFFLRFLEASQISCRKFGLHRHRHSFQSILHIEAATTWGRCLFTNKLTRLAGRNSHQSCVRKILRLDSTRLPQRYVRIQCDHQAVCPMIC